MTGIAIYGSCVSRDALSLVEHHRYKLEAYFARSSLASSCAEPSNALTGRVMQGVGNIESEFQRRMVVADVKKIAVSELSAVSCDSLVVDLIDERFNLFDTQEGICTVSNEFLRTGLVPAREELTRPGTRRHWDLWRKGLDVFCRAMENRPVILNQAYWASVTIDGESLEPTFAVRANNELLERMYGEFRSSVLHCDVINYPAELLVADPGHRWGLSPFHYVPAFYAHTIKQLDCLFAAKPLSA